MKKLFTFVAASAMALAAAAQTTLWEGSTTFAAYTVSEGTRPVIANTAFANAKVGDKIVCAITYNAADTESWHQVELYAYDAASEAVTTSLCQGVHVVEGDTQASFTVDEALLAKLQSTPQIALAGTGYTVTKVTLEVFDGTIWSGDVVVNWQNAATIQGSAFISAKSGDQLVFTVEVIEDAWAAITLNGVNPWKENLLPQRVLTFGETRVVYDLTDDEWASLKSSGIYVTGANYRLKKIAIIDPAASLIDVVAADKAADTTVYNLRGMRVASSLNAQLPAGLYIVGGHKVLVK